MPLRSQGQQQQQVQRHATGVHRPKQQQDRRYRMEITSVLPDRQPSMGSRQLLLPVTQAPSLSMLRYVPIPRRGPAPPARAAVVARRRARVMPMRTAVPYQYLGNAAGRNSYPPCAAAWRHRKPRVECSVLTPIVFTVHVFEYAVCANGMDTAVFSSIIPVPGVVCRCAHSCIRIGIHLATSATIEMPGTV